MEHLYFIAILFSDHVAAQITELKYEMQRKFDSSHALKSPPHITLHMPFKWKEKRLHQLYSLINNLNEEVTPFNVQLKDFDFFEPRVVFINVVQNKYLEELQKVVVENCKRELKLNNANYKNQAFHPHVTIGFRDLKKPMFYKAQQYFANQSIGFQFVIDRIHLLKHEDKQWTACPI